jgi:hypothetical protein
MPSNPILYSSSYCYIYIYIYIYIFMRSLVITVKAKLNRLCVAWSYIQYNILRDCDFKRDILLAT